MATWKGVFFSADSGVSWNPSSNIWSGPLNPVVAMVALGPKLYAFNTGDEGETTAFSSNDSGKTWITSPQPPSDIWTVVANQGNMFAALEGGIFLSTDSGNTWSNKSIGLTDSIIFSLAFTDTDIFAVAANDS